MTLHRRDLINLKARVLAALRSRPVPHDDDGRALADLGNWVTARWKGRPRVQIVGKHGNPSMSYGADIQNALEDAGLRVRYGLYSPCTEGRFVGGTSHAYIEIPLDQETGPWGYDCA